MFVKTLRENKNSYDYDSSDVDYFAEDSYIRDKGFNREKEELSFTEPFFYNEDLKSSQAKVLAKFVLKQLGFT